METSALPLRHVLILGTGGSGKTTCAKQILASSTGNVIAFDSQDELGDIGLRDAASLTEIESLYSSGKPFRVRWFNRHEKAFDLLCELVMIEQGKNPRPLTFMLDEMTTHFSTQYISEPFENVLLRGRRKNIQLVLVSQFAYRIPPEVRGMVKTIYHFNPGPGKNAVRFGEELGLDPKKLQRLKTGQFEIYPFETPDLPHSDKRDAIGGRSKK